MRPVFLLRLIISLVVISNELLSASTLRQVKDNELIYDPRAVKDKGILGEYDKQSDIIFLSLNRINPDGNLTESDIQQKLNRVLDHEMIHAFREKDLISEKEYQYLRAEVKRKKVPTEYDSSSKNETFYTRAKRINSGTANDAISRGASKERVEEINKEILKTKETIYQINWNENKDLSPAYLT